MTLTKALWLLIVGGALGCGGAAKPAAPPPTAPPPSTTCAAAAAHVGAMVAEGGEAAALIEQVMRESCEGDAWSPAGIDCMAKVSVDLSQLAPAYPEGSPERMGGCGQALTEDQQRGIGRRFSAEVDRRMNADAVPPQPADDELAPPPPPPPPPPPR